MGAEGQHVVYFLVVGESGQATTRCRVRNGRRWTLTWDLREVTSAGSFDSKAVKQTRWLGLIVLF